jgi:hypothetical protein
MKVSESAGYGLRRLKDRWLNQPGFRRKKKSGRKRRKSR